MTLAADKSAGHKRETPQIPPTKKKEQYHCALSNQTPGILCIFQCNSKTELDKHIHEEHKIFPCTKECNSLEILANHAAAVHKKEENKMSTEIICNICEHKCQTKCELMEHIRTHKSYKSVVRTEPRAEQEQETARPVLWSSLVAQGPKTVPNVSEEALNKIKKMTTQVIESQIKEMLPQILTKVAAALNLTLQ